MKEVFYHWVWLECINGGKQIKRASLMYILQNGYLCDSHWPWATPPSEILPEPTQYATCSPTEILPISC